MKRFLVTLAAMLLVNIGIFAQSSTPLKGDVNEDGVVDVADIVAVINIIKNGQDPNTTVYEYLLTNELPTEIPTFSKAYTNSMRLGALDGFDNWKNKDNQYIVFPVQSGKTNVSDYFTLTDMFGGNLEEDFNITSTSVSGLGNKIIVLRWNWNVPLSEDDGATATIEFK